ncbi:MAG: hypothetical protein FD180_4765, partial [Planctomycetota bacterium]
MKKPIALALLAVTAFAGDPDPAKIAAGLREQLAAYDANNGGNTIPIEESFIALRDAKAGKEITPFLEHKRFGWFAAWAASGCGDAALAGPVVAEFRKRSDREAAEFALHVGAFATGDARTAL